MNKEQIGSYGFILGLTHRHPKFTSGSHEIGEGTGSKRYAKPTGFSMTVDKKIPDQAGITTIFLTRHN